MAQKPDLRRVSDAEIEEEEVRYRLRQFYMILLVADKSRLEAMDQAAESSKKTIKPD